MMIRELHSDLSWAQVAEVFNIVFRNDRNENPRTKKMLQRLMTHRNGDQKALWDAADADLTTRNRWQPAIDAAMSELRDNPDQAPITPASEPTLNWDYERRLASHLLMEDSDLSMQRRTDIFNKITQAFRATQKVKPLSKEAFGGQHHREKRNAKRATAAGPQEPPVKSNASGKKKPTAVQDWQRILQATQTKLDLAKAAELQEEIDALKALQAAGKDLGDYDEDDENESENEDEDEVDELETEMEAHKHGDQAEPSFNPNENVGGWHFGTWYDWNQARINLGRQLTGMPPTPTAEDVRRLRRQLKRAGRFDSWTQGINIYRGPETVDWEKVNPETLYGSQQGRQGESSSRPALPKNLRDGVVATATDESGGDVNNSGGETAAEEAVEEDENQESGPEDGPEAKKGRSGNVKPSQRSLLMREKINKHLLRSEPESAPEVQKLFDQFDQSTRAHAILRHSNPQLAAEHRQLLDELNQILAGWIARFGGERHASRKRKRS
jgi:hypothetical protein